MQRLRIDHVTEYVFGAPVTLLPHRMLLRPRSGHSVRVESSELTISPEPSIRWQRDELDNSVAIASFTGLADRLRIASSVVIEHYDEAPLDFVVEDYAVMHPFEYVAAQALVLAPFRAPIWSAEAHAIEPWLASLGLRGGPMEAFVLLDQMNRAIHAFRYRPREEPGVQSPAQTLSLREGSCRDFATLFMEACRALGLASRFVSGYLHGPASRDVDGATHAWAEVYLPGPGWKGFDPTCGELTGPSHIPVAFANHPEHVPPVAGSFLGPAGLSPTMRVTVRSCALPS